MTEFMQWKLLQQMKLFWSSFLTIAEVIIAEDLSSATSRKATKTFLKGAAFVR